MHAEHAGQRGVEPRPPGLSRHVCRVRHGTASHATANPLLGPRQGFWGAVPSQQPPSLLVDHLPPYQDPNGVPLPRTGDRHPHGDAPPAAPCPPSPRWGGRRGGQEGAGLVPKGTWGTAGPQGWGHCLPHQPRGGHSGSEGVSDTTAWGSSPPHAPSVGGIASPGTPPAPRPGGVPHPQPSPGGSGEGGPGRAPTSGPAVKTPPALTCSELNPG